MRVSTTDRVDSLDLARGIAITLMIVSHTIKGLLSYEQMPSWGLMPIHTITKFSSSTFFLVFGITLAVFFAPTTGTPRWPKKRNRLLLRGLEILVWYKILTVVQMFHTYPKQMVIDTLLFVRFPDFVEVLGFYGFFLLWFPILLPLWRKTYAPLKIAAVFGLAYAGYYLNLHFDFWGHQPLKAILVEEEGFYTFGQFQRGALVLAGCILGDLYLQMQKGERANLYFALSLFFLAASSLSFFYVGEKNQIVESLIDISFNRGKHPPNLVFTTFSVGGALFIIGCCFLFARQLPKWFFPITIIGRAPFFAFCFHIILIFLFYRYFLGLHQMVSYQTAWMLTILTLIMTSFMAWCFDSRRLAN